MKAKFIHCLLSLISLAASVSSFAQGGLQGEVLENTILLDPVQNSEGFVNCGTINFKFDKSELRAQLSFKEFMEHFVNSIRFLHDEEKQRILNKASSVIIVFYDSNGGLHLKKLDDMLKMGEHIPLMPDFDKQLLGAMLADDYCHIPFNFREYALIIPGTKRGPCGFIKVPTEIYNKAVLKILLWEVETAYQFAASVAAQSKEA